MQITPELVTSIAGLIGALGVAIKQVRDVRKERRSRRRSERAIAKVARAAARDNNPAVAQVVDELDRTGEIRRFEMPDDDDGKAP